MAHGGISAASAAFGALAVAVVSTGAFRAFGVAGADDLSYARVALDTAAATIGLVLAMLLYGRFRLSSLVRDALLCASLLLLGAANTVFGVVPVVLNGGSGRLTSASAVAGLVAGVLFALSVLLPAWSVPVPLRDRIPAAVTGATAVVLLVALVVSEVLPRTGTASADTFGASRDASLVVAQLLAAGAFAAAAVGWVRGSRDDTIAVPMACAAVLAAASRVDFAIADSAASSSYAAGMLLRVLFYGALLLTAVLEIRSYWGRAGEAAALEERRRMARDLHDGMAQELAFAATQARALADRSEHPTRARLIAAATERALDESRRAIAALTRPLDEPLAVSLAQCAEEICERFDVSLVLDVEPEVAATPEVREALLRIVREATTNAARHGGAQAVKVSLSDGGGLLLRVEDDGAGFDVDDRRHLSGRFGLVSMRERAEALGGSFAVASRAPGGTTVEVRLP